MMKYGILMVVCATFVASTGAFAADPVAGKFKSKVCAGCHGVDGNNNTPDFPRLAGQHSDYLAKALSDYKSGARKNAIMGAQAKNLSQRDIDDIAAYFSQQKGLYTKY